MVSKLTSNFREFHLPQAIDVKPEAVIQVLNAAGVKFILFGLHGIASWLPHTRATQDVDVVVQKRHFAKAVRAIREAFPQLVPQAHEVVTRFIDPAVNEAVIDLMRPVDLYSIAFDHTITTSDSLRIPVLEMALAAKFGAMISRTRSRPKKHQDASDFINVVKRNYPRIDWSRLATLGEAVYPGGGVELKKMVEDANNDRELRL